MAYIKKLKDVNDNTVYPQSVTSAIVNSEGISLDAIHQNFIISEDVEEVQTVGMQYELLSNKATVVNGNSTDAEYPTAKAVYDLMLANKTTGISIEIVENLPIENIDATTFYLVPSQDGTEESVYDEYLYINNKWEKVGSTKIDLTNYYTKTEIDNNFASKTIYEDTEINIGRKTGTAKGSNSVTLGLQATASGKGSLATSYCTASGSYSVAAGVDSVSSAYGAVAAGQGAQASFAGQTAIGRFNIADTESMFIVGNGGSASSLSNAHKINLDGTAWFQGDIYVGSTSGTNKDEGSKKIATEEYVSLNAMPASSTVEAFWNGTQAEYDALGTYDSQTLYLIDEE